MGGRPVLEHADTFELLSLQPEPPLESPEHGFHGYKVLGKCQILGEDKRKVIVKAFEAGVKEEKGLIAACFEPHHGLRVTRNRKSVDFVICFEYFYAYIYINSKLSNGFRITCSPRPVFDKELREAGVPLPEH